jgi:hypothetical protein
VTLILGESRLREMAVVAEPTERILLFLRAETGLIDQDELFSLLFHIVRSAQQVS